MMKRDLQRLRDEEFDLLVIGAGVNGAAAAWDASLRGLNTALIDKGDFGAATSAGCFKILHGGLRYLQHFDLRRLLESVEEQRLVRRIAPHLLSPLPFLVPCYRPILKRRLTMRLALSLYEILAWRRNREVPPSLRLPSFRVLSVAECLAIAPDLSTDGLEGGVLYHDVQMHNCDRLTLGLVQAASLAGCASVNYLALEGVEDCSSEYSSNRPLEANHTDTNHAGANQIDCKRLLTARVRDLVSGECFSIRARYYLNATGPWIEPLAAIMGYSTAKKPRYSKGVQLVVPELTAGCAFAVESKASDAAAVVSRGGRSYFVQPWNGYSLLGTSDELVEEFPDDFRITDRDVERFINEFRSAYPCKQVSCSKVLFAFGGLRPLAEDIDITEEGEDARTARKDLIVDHMRVPFGREKIANLASMRGVKYTTFRLLAKRTIDLVVEKLAVAGKLGKTVRCRTAESQLPAAPNIDTPKYEALLQKTFPEIDTLYMHYLVRNYGTASKSILEIHANEGKQQVWPAHFCREAELLYCLRKEMVVKLDDLLCRRVPLCATGIPPESVLIRCASLAGNELGWDAERRQDEIHELISRYGMGTSKLESRTMDVQNSQNR